VRHCTDDHLRQTVEMASNSSANPSATLAVISDHVDRYHEQVGDLLPQYQVTDQADMVNALVEAERALRTAARLVRKAAKLAAQQNHRN
jgi:hypothetical protein